jgi:hypothetical protein
LPLAAKRLRLWEPERQRRRQGARSACSARLLSRGAAVARASLPPFAAEAIALPPTIARAGDRGLKFAAIKADFAERMGINQAQQLGGRPLGPVLPVGPPRRPQEFAHAPAARPPRAQPELAVLGTRHGDLLKRRRGGESSVAPPSSTPPPAGQCAGRSPPPLEAILRGAPDAVAGSLKLAMLKHNCM